MRPSRGMGAINPDKLPKKGKRKDGCEFDIYAKGGKTKLSPSEKANTNRAKAAGNKHRKVK